MLARIGQERENGSLFLLDSDLKEKWKSLLQIATEFTQRPTLAARNWQTETGRPKLGPEAGGNGPRRGSVAFVAEESVFQAMARS